MKSRFFKNPCRCVNQIGKPELRYQRKQKQININVQASRSQRAYGIRQYLGIQYSMSEERKTELLRNFVGWFLDHQTSDEGLFRDLHVEIGMTKKELHDYGIDIDKQFEQAEKEHEKEVDEATDMITAEDIVEQAVYAANAPECCADKHAEYILSMLGANIVDEDMYHDEDECPNIRQAVIESVKTEYDLYEGELMKGTPETVYAHSHETTVKSYLRDTICEDCELDGEAYRALYEDKGNILRDLHEDYISEPEASMATLDDPSGIY